ncbi:MAG: pilus assembly protein [Sheuella sp.]|nr:pilus assembly protein [Sheuella sp.]
MRIKLSACRQHGAAIIETCLVLMPLLLFAGLIFEFTHSHKVRQIAQLALYEAARAGSVSAVRPERIDQAFRNAILPLFVPLGRHPSAESRLDAASRTILKDTGLKHWQIEVLNPGPFTFMDYAHPALSGQNRRPTLRNEYLKEQHQANVTKGWSEGRGPASGLDVFEANTLRLRLSMLYRPLVPGVGLVLKALGAWRTDRTGQAWINGYLVADLLTEVMMQSHAQQWQSTQQAESTLQAEFALPDNVKPKPFPLETERMSRALAPYSTPAPSQLVTNTSTPIKNAHHEAGTVNPDAAVTAVTATGQSIEDDSAEDDNRMCDGLLCCQ